MIVYDIVLSPAVKVAVIGLLQAAGSSPSRPC